MAHELAIIGLDCRFPGSRNVAQFWENLKSGADCGSSYDDAPGVARSPHFVGRAYELEDIERFDAAFFDIAPLQARVMSPQHRLSLESAWSACEHAGYNPLRFGEDAGVFVASDDNTYAMGLRSNPEVARMGAQRLVLLGNYLAYLPAWIAFKLNLKGPSFAINAGCSSALVGVHLACNSLLLGECGIAIVTAVQALVPQRGYYYYEPGGIESDDGYCRPFDANGRGTVYGNGVGTLVLKRMKDAISDGDTIHAVVRGSALNTDGAAKLSFMAPNSESWTDVILQALDNAEVHPDSIGYVETHGVGTAVGDALELHAMARAFAKHTSRRAYCAIGSVKANIGHSQAAAGMAGLIKTICILRDGLIPPVAHFATPNPKADFASTPFFVPRSLLPWQRGTTPRRAAVSAFGIGGGNAHVVLEEGPRSAAGEHAPAARGEHILFLSARSGTALRSMASDLLEHLSVNPSLPIEQVAYTLAVGRESFEYRRAIVCSDIREATEALRRLQRNPIAAPPPKLMRPVFVIADVGTAALQRSQALGALIPEFRQAFAQCTAALRAEPELDFQLAPFAVAYAVAKTWIAMGIRPVAMIGHGIGRYVTATLCGCMDIPAALRLARAHVECGNGSCAREDGMLRPEELSAPRIPFLSHVTGEWITPQEATDARYWLDSLVPDSPDPSPPEAEMEEAGYCAVETGLVRTMPEILRDLWESGIEISKEMVAGGLAGRRIPLPTYPFERERYWIDPVPAIQPAADVDAITERRVEDLHDASGRLLQVCRELLGMPDLDPRDNFFDLGANSLQMQQLRTRIREYLGV
jgi:acyl transferase domain-containing protein